MLQPLYLILQPLYLILRCARKKWLGWVSCSPFPIIKSIPTRKKSFDARKSGPNATFSLIFLWLGWPWVGEFFGFMTILTCFPTQQNFANGKHPNYDHCNLCLRPLYLTFTTTSPYIHATIARNIYDHCTSHLRPLHRIFTTTTPYIYDHCTLH